MTGDAWDTDLGRWALAWRDYLRSTTNPASVSSSSVVESADAAFAREIALAHEVCDDAIAADAATAFVPDVPLPFGGDGGSRE